MKEIRKKILITGATGYIGGRLLKSLEDSEHDLSCLVRKPEHLKSKVSDQVKIIKGNVLDKSTLKKALQYIDTAFYLVHSMGAKKGFEEKDPLDKAHNSRWGGIIILIYSVITSITIGSAN